MTAAEWPLVVTLGEMLLRLSPGDQGRLFASNEMRAGFGGAEANVAVALSHLDIWCEYVTRLPDNLIGDAALAVLRDEGVQLSHVLRGPERMGLYFVEPGADVGGSHVVYDRGATAFASIAPAMLDWPAILADARWFHATGINIALGHSPIATLAAAIAAARAAGVPVSIDLNYWPALWRDRDAASLVTPLVHDIDLLIANPHSARAMLGLDVPDDVLASTDGALELARLITNRFGCRRVALTRREVFPPNENRWSARLYQADSDELIESQRWTVAVVDRIGSGDAFAASLIAATLHGRAPIDALEFAVAASALKLRVPGDFNRVSPVDVDRMLQAMAAAGERARELRG